MQTILNLKKKISVFTFHALRELSKVADVPKSCEKPNIWRDILSPLMQSWICIDHDCAKTTHSLKMVDFQPQKLSIFSNFPAGGKLNVHRL